VQWMMPVACMWGCCCHTSSFAVCTAEDSLTEGAGPDESCCCCCCVRVWSDVDGVCEPKHVGVGGVEWLLPMHPRPLSRRSRKSEIRGLQRCDVSDLFKSVMASVSWSGDGARVHAIACARHCVCILSWVGCMGYCVMCEWGVSVWCVA
jgi:hypothetical protein